MWRIVSGPQLVDVFLIWLFRFHILEIKLECSSFDAIDVQFCAFLIGKATVINVGVRIG